MPTNGHLTPGITSDTIMIMRVVLDTNVIVAGLRSRRGASFKLLSLVGTGSFETVVSVPLVFEYEATLKAQASMLGVTAEQVEKFVDRFCQNSSQHDIFYLWRPSLRDPRDEFVLELALSAGCQAIVTHNVRNFVEVRSLSVAVMTPATFLKKVENRS